MADLNHRRAARRFVAFGVLILPLVAFAFPHTLGTATPASSSSSSTTTTSSGFGATRSGALTVSRSGALSGSTTDPDGPYHSGSKLLCSDCHSMHASEQHSMIGTNTDQDPIYGVWTYPWNQPANNKLLRRASSTQLCLACHDGKSGIPDVVEGDANGLTERAAGLFTDPGNVSFQGHSLSLTELGNVCDRCHSSSPRGAMVQCSDCHNIHGNGNYRNVQWASAPATTPRILAFIRPGVSGTARYERGNIGYSAPSSSDTTYREVSNICIDCHHAFTDDSIHMNTKDPSTGEWTRHPATNSEGGTYSVLNRTGAATDTANWLQGPTGGVGFSVGRVPFMVSGAASFADATTVAANNQVFCLSCHKAHGSENPFGLRWPGGTNGFGCTQCHAQVTR